MNAENNITWEIFPPEHAHKNPDWFWSIGIIATAVAVIAILSNNYLFAVLIVIAALTLFIHAIKKQNTRHVTIGDRGITLGEISFSYKNLRSFCIHHDEDKMDLVLKQKNKLSSSIVIPFHHENENEIREKLLVRLKEEELEIPLSYKILEFLGL